MPVSMDWERTRSDRFGKDGGLRTVDAVYIATPNRFHAQQAEIFLKRGIHVLCEKPAVVTSAELERLLAAAEKSGAVFMEAIMAPHQPRFAQLKQGGRGDRKAERRCPQLLTAFLPLSGAAAGRTAQYLQP